MNERLEQLWYAGLSADGVELDSYKSMASCNIEKNRLMKKPEKGITFVCLKVDYE